MPPVNQATVILGRKIHGCH